MVPHDQRYLGPTLKEPPPAADSSRMATCRAPSRPDDDGFTLVELMVVVLIIAILLAIAVPTFISAQRRAHDRAAQSNARNAHVVELVVYADNQEFTDDVAVLVSEDSSLGYTQALNAMTANGRVVYVELLPDTLTPNDSVLVGAKSHSGKCFWIRAIGGVNQMRFADNDCGATPAPASFRQAW